MNAFKGVRTHFGRKIGETGRAKEPNGGEGAFYGQMFQIPSLVAPASREALACTHRSHMAVLIVYQHQL